MVFFMQQGNRYRMTPSQAVLFKEKLPVGTYTVGFCEGYYFEQIEDLELPKKLYGNTSQNANRILSTFLDRPASAGILLSGQKGSGKTLLAKVISARAAQQGIPTLVINTESCAGDSFNKFLQTMEQPAVLIFDEFEKIFGYDAQQQMLTLLDGLYPSKKLFLLTSNERCRVNDNMIDRPGRVFYVLEFEGVDIDFVRGYCQDNLDNQDHVPQVVSMFRLFSTFTFDILKALVEEMNRYKENPAKALRLLNARPDLSDSVQYDIELEVNGKKLDHDKDGVDKTRDINLFRGRFDVSYKVLKPKKKKSSTKKEGEEKKETDITSFPGEDNQDDNVSNQNHIVPDDNMDGGSEYDGEEYDDEEDDDDGGYGYNGWGRSRDEVRYEWKKADFSYRDLVAVNSIQGVYHLQNSKRERLVLTRTNRSHALDLEWLCSLEQPLEATTGNSKNGGGGAGQVMDVVRLSDNGSHDGW